MTQWILSITLCIIAVFPSVCYRNHYPVTRIAFKSASNAKRSYNIDEYIEKYQQQYQDGEFNIDNEKENIVEEPEVENVNNYQSDQLATMLRRRSMRFYDNAMIRSKERCFLVGIEDNSPSSEMNNGYIKYSMEESLTELSELAGAAGLHVIASTYQRIHRPNTEYFIGAGKIKEISRLVRQYDCSCIIFDIELSPSQQKNLEIVFNEKDNQKQSSNKKNINLKVLDRTALILDIFAQHARTREGQLQVQLALLNYRLPRLTNMWSHLERQSATSRGKSNGGVGLRGPGETQLESDRRAMKRKINALTKVIDDVKKHRRMQRRRRRMLGIPVVALVGYTNSGKSTLLNAFTATAAGRSCVAGERQTRDPADSDKDDKQVFVADMLFATLDPTTRLVSMNKEKMPDVLMTDTVGFIQKLPTNLVAAFRATLEEIHEADILLHVTDVSNDAWKKQQAAVLSELESMGLSHKPLITVWNKLDLVKDRYQREQLEVAAEDRENTCAISAKTGEGLGRLVDIAGQVLQTSMEDFVCELHYSSEGGAGDDSSESNTVSAGNLLHRLHQLASIDHVEYLDQYVLVSGKCPRFLLEQLIQLDEEGSSSNTIDKDSDHSRGEGLWDVLEGDVEQMDDQQLYQLLYNDNVDQYQPAMKDQPSYNKRVVVVRNKQEYRRRYFDYDNDRYHVDSDHEDEDEDEGDEDDLLLSLLDQDEEEEFVSATAGKLSDEGDDDDVNWAQLAKGRHAEVKKYKTNQ